MNELLQQLHSPNELEQLTAAYELLYLARQPGFYPEQPYTNRRSDSLSVRLRLHRLWRIRPLENLPTSRDLDSPQSEALRG